MIFAGPEQDLFQINAWTMQAQPGGSGVFGITTSKIARVGVTVGSVVRQGAMMGINYVINDLPLGVAITVVVDPKPGAFVIANSDSSFNFFQVSGPLATTLTPLHLTEKPVDFEARPFLAPR